MAMALPSEIFQEFQMKKWLGKIWEKQDLHIVAIGERKSLYGPLWSLHGNLKDRPRPGMLALNGSPLVNYYDGYADGVMLHVSLVPALSDATGYKDESYFRQARYDVANADLVVYCVDMSATRLRGSVLRTFQEVKPEWNRTVIALTFADALPALVRHRDNPAFSKCDYFNDKLAEWTRELRAMLQRIGMEEKVVDKIRFYPVGDELKHLPNGEPWLPPLSLAIMEILSPEKKAAFLKDHAAQLPTVTAAAIQPSTLSQTISTAAELMPTMHVSTRTESQSSRMSNLQASSVSSTLSEDQSRSVKAALSKLRKDCPIFGILVIGRTGVGKSTLINNLLGKEVASVGHTLQSETPAVYPHDHEDSVEGVQIVVYDTPGLGDVKGEEDEKMHLEIIRDHLAKKKIHLVVYCFQLNEMIMSSSLIGAINKYHKIGVDWERSVIALTFADALYVTKWEQEVENFNISQEEDFNISQYFDKRVDSIQKDLEFGMKTDVHLKICPTSLHPKDKLPNGEPWYVPFWLHIVEILSPAATVRFLDIHRNNICDDQAPLLSKNVKVEVKLSEEERYRFCVNIAAIIEEAGMDSSEVMHALAGVSSSEVKRVPFVRDILNLFALEQTDQSGSEAHSDRQTILDCFECFGDRFVKDVQSRDNPAFTSKLYRQKVIPENLKNQIAVAPDGATANEHLFAFLCQQATCESLSKLVAAMIEAEGYPAMNELGREMQAKLGLQTPAPGAMRYCTVI